MNKYFSPLRVYRCVDLQFPKQVVNVCRNLRGGDETLWNGMIPGEAALARPPLRPSVLYRQYCGEVVCETAFLTDSERVSGVTNFTSTMTDTAVNSVRVSRSD